MRVVVGFDLTNPKLKSQLMMAGDDEQRKLMCIGDFLQKVSQGTVSAKVDLAEVEPELEILKKKRKKKAVKS